MIAYWKLKPFNGLLQVLGLAAAWVHGSLGLYGWLRLHRWWPFVVQFLYPATFFLPILALLGFVEAGKVRLALGKFAALSSTLLVGRDRFLFGHAIATAGALVFAVQAIRRRAPGSASPTRPRRQPRGRAACRGRGDGRQRWRP
jgi:hypothetical protein